MNAMNLHQRRHHNIKETRRTLTYNSSHQKRLALKGSKIFRVLLKDKKGNLDICGPHGCKWRLLGSPYISV
jgi:hypothetical protein